MSANVIISIRGLEKTFPSNRGLVQAVQKIDLEVPENEFVVLLGPIDTLALGLWFFLHFRQLLARTLSSSGSSTMRMFLYNL